MLLLTDFSDAPRFTLHAPYQQATGDWGSWDARRAFSGVTKHVMQAHDPIGAVQATQLAIKHALAGQPGPVAVLYSHDSLAGSVAPDSQPALYPTRHYLPPAPPPAEPARVEAAAKAILSAQKPVVIAGNGVRIAQAYDQLRQLVEAAGLPVATTAAGKGCFAETHPLALGVFGTFGTEAGNACVAEADLVLVIGSKLSPSDTAWENRALLDPTRQTFVQIDIEPRNASWNYPAEHVLIGDAAAVLDQLIEAVGSPGHRAPATGRAARRRPSRTARLFQRPRLFRRRQADPAAAPDRRIDARAAGGRDRHLRRRREPHHDDAFLPDQAGRGLSAGRGLWADGLRHPGRPRGEARPSRPAGRRGRRRRRLCDDDERADDRGRAGHPDHHRRLQQQRVGVGIARLGTVRRRVQRLGPRRDRPGVGLPGCPGRRPGGAEAGTAGRARRAPAERHRRAHLAQNHLRRHHLAIGQRRLAAPALPSASPHFSKRGGASGLVGVDRGTGGSERVSTPSPRLRGEGRGEGHSEAEGWRRCGARTNGARPGHDRCGAPSRRQNSCCGHAFAAGNWAASNSSARRPSAGITPISFVATGP